jgi:phosphoserine phosphatase
MTRSDHQVRLFIFDMDGTLLPGTTGLLELAKILGAQDSLREMEERYSRKLLNTRDFTHALGALWGKVSVADSKRAFEAAPKLDGIAECLQELKGLGHISCLITMSQDIFAQHFKSYGFDYIASTTYPANTEGPVTILEPEDKRRIAKEICASHQLDYRQSVAFGDSLSDEPLFTDLINTVAVNATPGLQRISKHVYQGMSLMDAYRLVNHGAGA